MLHPGWEPGWGEDIHRPQLGAANDDVLEILKFGGGHDHWSVPLQDVRDDQARRLPRTVRADGDRGNAVVTGYEVARASATSGDQSIGTRPGGVRDGYGAFLSGGAPACSGRR